MHYLDQAEENGKDTHEASCSAGNVHARGGALGGRGRGSRAGSARGDHDGAALSTRGRVCDEAASVLALDDVAGTGEGLEVLAIRLNISLGVEVEGTLDIAESREGDAANG